MKFLEQLAKKLHKKPEPDRSEVDHQFWREVVEAAYGCPRAKEALRKEAA